MVILEMKPENKQSLPDSGQIEDYARILECIHWKSHPIYVSTPITTGRLYLDWWQRRGRSIVDKFGERSKRYESEFNSEVVQKNQALANAVIKRVKMQREEPVIDPTQFTMENWDQDEYRHYWLQVIIRFVSTVVFVDGWQYSSGCSYELLTALDEGKEVLDESLNPISLEIASQLVEHAVLEYQSLDVPADILPKVLSELTAILGRIDRPTERRKLLARLPVALETDTKSSYKDEVLNNEAQFSNVAQFVSFGLAPELDIRFFRIRGLDANTQFSSAREAIEALLAKSVEKAVNVRSFRPDGTRGMKMVKGLRDADQVVDVVRDRSSKGIYTIVNESINIMDGGVSGVILGDVIEFSPDATPKCVDEDGICTVPRRIGMNILERTYGFRPALHYDEGLRVEFSIHPQKRGLKNDHTIIWEMEIASLTPHNCDIRWPNNFSRKIGDKAFGLMLADAYGLPVPRTTVVSRTIAPFTFGTRTGTESYWMRTCPAVRSPGLYPTFNYWKDPFKLLTEIGQQQSDPFVIASVLAQEGVRPRYSGKLLPSESDVTLPHIEGDKGNGQDVVMGNSGPRPLPDEVRSAVFLMYNEARKHLGPVEIEWVYDGERAWVVQLHKTNYRAEGDVICKGYSKKIITFQVTKGKAEKQLKKFEKLIASIKGKSVGIELVGDIGVLSHFGDHLRDANIPSRLRRKLADDPPVLFSK